MTLLERRRQQFFRSKLNEEVEEQTMTNEDRSQIAVLAARFAERTYDIMCLADAIEAAIDKYIARTGVYKPTKVSEEPCEKS